MKRFLSLAIAIALVLGMTQVAFARPIYLKVAPYKIPYRYEFRTPLSPGQNLIKLLDLTEEQIGKIKELREKYYNKLKELWNKLQDVVFSLRQLQFQKQPDTSLIDKKREEINNIRKEIRGVLDEYWKEFKSILTKDQLSKLNKTLPPFRPRRAPWGFCPFFRW